MDTVEISRPGDTQVLIVGAGPAGLSAAITLASEGRSVILLEKQEQAGGQAGTSALIENLLPHPEGFSGAHFTAASCAQCSKFGVQIEYNTEVVSIIPERGGYVLITNQGQYQGRAVLLALGLKHRLLGVPGEDLPNVHHGMKMDALECPDEAHVVLVGGGNAVGQAALYYLGRGAQVTIIARRPLRETMSSYLIERLRGRTDVKQGQVTSIQDRGNGWLTVVIDGQYNLFYIDCLHVFIGQEPRTDWLEGLVVRDTAGYIITDMQHQTNRRGIFAVGDVVSDSVKRVACAIGYGNEVVPTIHHYLESLRSQDLDGLERDAA